MDEPLFRDPKFDALRTALYHTERRNFLDLVNRLISFAIIVLGTAVVSRAADKFHFDSSYAEVGVVVLATLQLVFDFGGCARTHDFLQRKYYELLSEIEAEGATSEESKVRYSARLAVICSEEPMTMRALDAVAYNKAVDATIADPEQWRTSRLIITKWQYRLRHFCAFQSVNFAPVNASA